MKFIKNLYIKKENIMYNLEYDRWLHAVKEEDLLKELESIHGNDDAIKDRICSALNLAQQVCAVFLVQAQTV